MNNWGRSDERVDVSALNLLTAGTGFKKYHHLKCQILNTFKLKNDINLQDLKIVHLHFVKSV